jgi:very-short-patch-repair endonuclease
MTSRLPPDWVPPVARRQSGLFTVRQAREAGATEAQIRRRRSSGRWVTVVGGALTPAGSAIDAWTIVDAVALTWPDAVVSLSTAAQLYRIPVPDDGRVHLIVSKRTRSRRGVATHELDLDPRDVVHAGRGRVTSRERTVLDCIGWLPPSDSERLVAWAATRELVSTALIERALHERPRSWGSTARRRALTDVERGTLSAAERRLRLILRRKQLRGFEFNQRIDDDDGVVGRADALHRAARLVIEVDGFEYHARTQFQQDRTKQNRLVAFGYTVLRFTWEDLTRRPDVVADQIERLVARRLPRTVPGSRTDPSL